MSIPVPSLIGTHVHVARDVCTGLGLVLTSRAPDGPALGALTWPGYFLVTGQSPDAGTLLSPGDVVAIDFVADDGPGDADIPARPTPPPPTLDRRAEPDVAARRPARDDLRDREIGRSGTPGRTP